MNKLEILKEQVARFEREAKKKIQIINGRPIYVGDLYPLRCSFLPDGLIVIGNLDVSHSLLSRLPNGLIVTGNLDIRNTRIEDFPSNTFVGGSIFMAKTKIEILPPHFVVRGDLLIDWKITKFPESLTVCGNLDLTESEIKRIHSNVKVFGEILLKK